MIPMPSPPAGGSMMLTDGPTADVGGRRLRSYSPQREPCEDSSE
jgi:hypothetical protein